MAFWRVTGGLFIAGATAAAVAAWLGPPRPRMRWLVPLAVLVIGIVLLAPTRRVSLPMIFCSGPSDCYLSGAVCQTTFGLHVPVSDRWDYPPALPLALGTALGTAVAAAASRTLFTRRGTGPRS